MALTHLLKPAIKMSATMAMNTNINRLTSEGHQVYHLGFGEARFPVHPKILAAFRSAATERSYLPVAGLPELRTRIAGYHRRKFGVAVEADQVIIGSGSKSLLFAAVSALNGDMLLPAPAWVSYDSQAYLTGKAVHWIPTRLENNYCLTAADLQTGLQFAKVDGLNPTMLVLNSPCNPTGVVYPPQLLAELAAVAQAAGLVIISDEIYGETSYGETPFTSMARYYPEGTIVTGGLSKHLSLGGWRFGTAILPANDFGRQLYQQMSAIASNIWTTVTAPVQYAALVAYSDDAQIEAYIKACATIHGYVTGYLYEVLQSLNVPCPKPSGGFYVYPSLAPWREILARKHNIHTSSDLAHFLLDEEHIATLPGSDFGADPQDLSLRLATSYLYGLSDADGEAMLAALEGSPSPKQFLKDTCPRIIEVGEKFKVFVESLV